MSQRGDFNVVLVDAGGSNVGSVQAALQRLGVAAEMTADSEHIRAASHVILPGVGAARPGMQRLRDSGLDLLIPRLTQPVLGVCLGMQLLFESSEEADTQCLGVVPGRVARFCESTSFRLPHMGWNSLERLTDAPLLNGIQSGDYAYFVHSYAAPLGPASVASCRHGRVFTAALSWKNFHGAQFHPERSASVGARLLANFLEMKS
ncbi:MAG: imidazole glycerol phosphate synthase subunit HisH [Pseudomonadota bacterium]|nr:imidazole glycerol phosphate synthase subunit HisH [Pseudomonadota bacterium]